MRRRFLFVPVVIALTVVVGCSSGPKTDSATPGPATDPATTLNPPAAPDDTAPPTPIDTSNTEAVPPVMTAQGQDRDFCIKFIVWDGHLTHAKSAMSQESYQDLMGQVLLETRDLFSIAPAVLTDDLQVIGFTLGNYSMGDYEAPPEAAAAEAHITAWVKENCGGFDAGAT